MSYIYSNSSEPIIEFSEPPEEKLNIILTNQDAIIENQKVIIAGLQNWNKDKALIIQQLVKLEAMLDTIGCNIINNNRHEKQYATQMTGSDDVVANPIDTLADLQKLEKNLAEKEIMENYVTKYSFICGREGNSKGLNNCYTLIDRFFTRRFMTLCSWAGGARDKKEKIPFKIYKNTIEFFFRVVNLSDNSFTLNECEEFFKAIIRNSTRRSESSMSRTSKPKHRPKNLNYKIQGNIQTGEQRKEDEENRETILETNLSHND